MLPKVSIILPILNTQAFLEVRVQSIVTQTLKEWECIVIDGYSDDGSWEFLVASIGNDSRFQLFQTPRKGPYDAWNKGIEKARGKYVYIATSDDTMTPDCLVKMVLALENNPECSLSHCCLKVIDKDGKPSAWKNWDQFWNAQYFGALIHQPHIRLAPHDGVLHCGVQTVYTSITQLLIRRKLFEEIGFFRTDYGSIADFEWEMRASLLYHTVHVPEYLATWRQHAQQATSDNFIDTARHRQQLCQLVVQAFQAASQQNLTLATTLRLPDLLYLYRRDAFYFELYEQKGSLAKARILLKWLLQHPSLVADYARRRMGIPVAPFDRMAYIRSQMQQLGLLNHIRLIT